MSEGEISIVLPVQNQADHIGHLVGDYVDALRPLSRSYEIVLVPNACRDATEEVCQALAHEHATVRVVPSPAPGWGHAVRLGLEAARGELLCYTNSARTSAGDLGLLLRYALAAPGTVVKANRKIRDRWSRRIGSLLYNMECRTLFDLSCWDINGTPKIFPRSCTELLGLSRDDDLIDVEFVVICRRVGYPMLEVPIFSQRRHGGRSTTNLPSAVRMYWGAYQLWRTWR